MPNTFAFIALISWPFISLLFFYRHMPIVQATFWTIVGGFLFLPVRTAMDFPLIPPLDKESIPVITALIGCRYIKKVKITLLPKVGVERWLVLILLITPFITTLNNQETYNFIPGLTLHDTLSAVIGQYLFILPFIIGMQLVKTYEDQLLLFKLLVIAGLIYSVPILFEVRMSPQLHTWIYGFFPHTFAQQIRFGGFRPVVFLGHGLIVAMYLAITLGAATILMKEKIRIRKVSPWLVIGYFFTVLFLSKTVGAFLLGSLLFFANAWLPITIVKRLSLFLIFIVLLYPMLSIVDMFPHQMLVQMANDFDTDRGGSLAFRFYHENLLLEHAQQKLFFGWGGWGRNMLEESVTDGYWIILLGQYGLFGFVSLFGLAFLSVLRAIKSSRLLANKNERQLLLGHALIVSVIMADQLPNASMAAWLLLIIGGLLGRANSVIKIKPKDKT